MIIFGEPWDAPVCEGAEIIDPPVGTACAWCKVLVEEYDSGVVIPCLGEDGRVTMEPWHKECYFRSAVGSPAHIQGRCTCHGVQNESVQTPEDVRAEAIESWRLAHSLWSDDAG